MEQPSWFAVVVALVIAAVGCGGNVVVDSTSGAGLAGGSGGAGGAGGSTASNSTSTGPAFDPSAYCSSICNQFEPYMCLGGGTVAECAAGCVEAFNGYPNCWQQLIDYEDCQVAGLPGDVGCSGGEACLPLGDAFAYCASGSLGCALTASSDGPGGCNSHADCQNGETIDATCLPTSAGLECTCLVDDNVIGECAANDLTCDLDGGCCAKYFFENG